MQRPEDIGIVDWKRALTESGGDVERAKRWLQQRNAMTRTRRDANQGSIFSYSHGGRIGALVELNCETDFVTRTEQFATLGRDIASHVAAAAPQYLAPSDIPDEVRAAWHVDGRSDVEVDAALALLAQPFVGDARITMGEMVREAVERLGENIVVCRFVRYALGETRSDGEMGETTPDGGAGNDNDASGGAGSPVRPKGGGDDGGVAVRARAVEVERGSV